MNIMGDLRRVALQLVRSTMNGASQPFGKPDHEDSLTVVFAIVRLPNKQYTHHPPKLKSRLVHLRDPLEHASNHGIIAA